jgi:hypothetical protein
MTSSHTRSTLTTLTTLTTLAALAVLIVITWRSGPVDRWRRRQADVLPPEFDFPEFPGDEAGATAVTRP